MSEQVSYLLIVILLADNYHVLTWHAYKLHEKLISSLSQNENTLNFMWRKYVQFI